MSIYLGEGDSEKKVNLDATHRKIQENTADIEKLKSFDSSSAENSISSLKTKVSALEIGVLKKNSAGNLGMGDGKIIDLDDPTDSSDASTKRYVDSKTAVLLDTGGSRQMLGSLDMNGNRIVGLPVPTQSANPTTKKYVDDKLDEKLSKTGGTLVGDLIMHPSYNIGGIITPSQNSHAAPKKYVDDKIKSVLDGTERRTGELNVNNNRIINVPPPTSNNQATNKKYVDDKHVNSIYHTFSYINPKSGAWIEPGPVPSGHPENRFFLDNSKITNRTKINILGIIADNDSVLNISATTTISISCVMDRTDKGASDVVHLAINKKILSYKYGNYFSFNGDISEKLSDLDSSDYTYWNMMNMRCKFPWTGNETRVCFSIDY